MYTQQRKGVCVNGSIGFPTYKNKTKYSKSKMVTKQVTQGCNYVEDWGIQAEQSLPLTHAHTHSYTHTLIHTHAHTQIDLKDR